VSELPRDYWLYNRGFLFTDSHGRYSKVALYRWLIVYQMYFWWNRTVIWESCFRRRYLLIKLLANGAVRDQRLSQRSVSLLRGLLIGEDCTRFRNVGWLNSRQEVTYSSKTNKMQSYTMVFITTNALHVSGGSSAHHQELKTPYTASIGCLSNFFCFLPLLWVPAHSQ